MWRNPTLLRNSLCIAEDKTSEIRPLYCKRQAEPLLTGDPRSGERVACIHWAAHRRREDQAVRASGFPEEGF